MKWSSKILGTPSKILRTAQKNEMTSPLNLLIHISIDSSRRQDLEYIIYIGIDKCRQKVMIFDASWEGCVIPEVVDGGLKRGCF